MCPDTVLIKRLVALEGDWVAFPERIDIEKIPQVLHLLLKTTHVLANIDGM